MSGWPFTWRSSLLLGAWFGLLGGFLDLAAILLKKHVFYSILYYRLPRDFFWTLPVVNLVLVVLLGLTLAGLNRVRPGAVSQRLAAWMIVTLALWEPLLRMPVHGAASLVLAAGLGRWISGILIRRAPGSQRFLRRSLAGLFGLLIVLAALSTGRSMLAEHQALARLPAAPKGARNLLLIVMDTVRAESLSLYGYARPTSPRLSQWAKRGVRFDRAVAAASWTFPSHCCLLTAQWPSRLKAHWQLTLDSTYPTLAEYLAAHGYVTAGFVANTNFCSYEAGLNRGFAHFEDYPRTLSIALGSSAIGRWVLKNVLYPRDFYRQKWIDQQSQDARGINQSFLDWQAGARAEGRPFFAFLNYLDAHEPFVASPDLGQHFGVRPESSREYMQLLNFWELDKVNLSAHETALARDSYEDCIAFLDRQVGLLLDELDRRGWLRDTQVVITSDHGEEFGEHGVYNHGYGLHAPEVWVPLLILSPKAPPGGTVSEASSLRDLPATIVDVLGLASGSPFPGRSLAARWREAAAQEQSTTPALSEVLIPAVLPRSKGPGPSQHGLTMSLIRGTDHYLLDSEGAELLHDLQRDPRELQNLMTSPDRSEDWRRLRRNLLGLLMTEFQPSVRIRGRRGLTDPATIVAEGSLRRYRSILESLMRGNRVPSPRSP